MTLKEIYRKFPTKKACFEYLEQRKWDGTPRCPYCQSHKRTPYKSEYRHHCNTCNCTYSVTVKSLFHKTRVDLQKWFYLITRQREGEIFTVRGLAEVIDVNSNTANFMLMKVRNRKLTEFENVIF